MLVVTKSATLERHGLWLYWKEVQVLGESRGGLSSLGANGIPAVMEDGS
jgi:hypothetical protein